MPSENSASNVATRWHGVLQWAFIRQEEKHTHMREECLLFLSGLGARSSIKPTSCTSCTA